MTLGPEGNYSTTWNNVGNFIAGKGWAVGSPNRVICYSGNFTGGYNGFLALYGWTKNEAIEYYVCENHGAWTPPGTADIINKGTFTSDGGTYTIYVATRSGRPSIIGEGSFKQYWSVRTETRSSGTITFANHVAAWQAAGMSMGTTWDYQIMETEGYQSSGSSNITIRDCTPTSCATPKPIATASISYCQNAAATALTATGTNLLWYSTETGGTGSSTAITPATTTIGSTNYYVSQLVDGCESARATIAVTVNAAPAATISVIGNTSIVPGEITTLQANSGTGLSYKWFNENTEVGIDATYPASSAGNYTVDVTNAAGCTSKSASTAISTRPNEPSVVTLTSLVDNATMDAPVTITATVTDVDGAIVLVEFLDGLTVIGSSTKAPYTMLWLNPSTGSHSITIRATDIFNSVTSSSPITISTGLTTNIQSSRTNVDGKIYPIPAKEYVMVETELDLAQANFRIINALGEEVSIPISIDGQNALLHVSSLSEGAYVIVIIENSSILTKKIILAQ